MGASYTARIASLSSADLVDALGWRSIAGWATRSGRGVVLLGH